VSHGLKQVWPSGRRYYVPECQCGWTGGLTTARWMAEAAHTKHAEEARVEAVPEFDGATYSHDRDHVRLGKQMLAVVEVLKDGDWHTLAELSQRTGYPEASISARIRDCRKARFGGKEIVSDYVRRGLWRYRLVLDE